MSGQQVDSVAVLEAWAEHTNDGGGIAGHPVALDVTDTRGDGARARATARRIVGDPSVAAVVLVDAAAEAASASPLSKGGVPIVGGVGFDPGVWGAGKNEMFNADQLPNVFGVTTAFPAYATEIAIAAKEAGLKNVAVAAEAENPNGAQGAAVVEDAAGKLGLNYKGTVPIPADAADYTAACRGFVKNEVDFVQLIMIDSVAIRVARDCKSEGYSGYFGASASSVAPKLYRGLGENKLTGGLSAFPWFVDDAPVKRFREVMEANGVSAEKYGQPTATGMWATMELFNKALETNASKLSDTVTRQNVLDAYHTVKNETLGGLLPSPVTYTAGRPAPAQQCFWLYTHQGGKFAGSLSPTCPGPEFAL